MSGTITKYSNHRTYSSAREDDDLEELAEFGGAVPDEGGGQKGVGGGLEQTALCVTCTCLCILASAYAHYIMKVEKFRVK